MEVFERENSTLNCICNCIYKFEIYAFEICVGPRHHARGAGGAGVPNVQEINPDYTVLDSAPQLDLPFIRH